MPKRTYTIQIEIWKDKEEQFEPITKLVQDHADQINSIMQIVHGTREPVVDVTMHAAGMGRVRLTSAFMTNEND